MKYLFLKGLFMAEQRNQTPAGDNTQWTTIIRPRTGWFDVDLEELWRYRDLIVMFVKRNFTVHVQADDLGPAVDHPEPAYHHRASSTWCSAALPAFYGRYAELFVLHGRQHGVDLSSPPASTARPTPLSPTRQVFGKVYFPAPYHPHQPGIDQPHQLLYPVCHVHSVLDLLLRRPARCTPDAWAFAVPLVVLEVMLLGLGVGIIVSVR